MSPQPRVSQISFAIVLFSPASLFVYIRGAIFVPRQRCKIGDIFFFTSKCASDKRAIRVGDICADVHIREELKSLTCAVHGKMVISFAARYRGRMKTIGCALIIVHDAGWDEIPSLVCISGRCELRNPMRVLRWTPIPQSVSCHPGHSTALRQRDVYVAPAFCVPTDSFPILQSRWNGIPDLY